MKDYYAILGVSPTTHAADIKRAYRRLALQYHPDKNPSPEAEQFIKELNEAYDVLGDPQKRFDYDQRRFNPVYEPAPTPPVHRDPRYRPSAPRTGPRKPSEQFVLMQRSIPFLTWVSRVGLVVVCIMLVDFLLPPRVHQTVVDSFYTVKTSRSGRAYYLITAEGESFGISYEANGRLRVGDEIEIIWSPIFARMKRFQCPVRQVTSSNLATVYGNYAFVPVLLGILSLIGVSVYDKVEFLFNVGFVNLIVLTVTLFLLVS